ncbi:MAG: hypothetical protein MRZ54_05715 [Clostridiales bacterium]|nr:hypothetical protein [Clostridiales bacterium]
MRMSIQKSAWKRALAAACALACLLAFAIPPARAAQQEIPDFCQPILEAWGATNEKELQDAVLAYWEENQPRDWKSLHKTIKKPVVIRFGGTTKELIQTHKEWDIAIVSSREADLQKLLDAGMLIIRGGSPNNEAALHQWCLPEAVQEKLPQHPLYYFAVYCYQYNAETDEAVFLVCNQKKRPLRATATWARQMLERRSHGKVRALEGICRKIDCECFGMPELSFTEEDLLARPDEWDWAFLRIAKDDRLERLDAAGLLYDFSQDEYWANRKPEWKEPAGIWSADGRMIAVPYGELIYNGPNEISIFVVNAQSQSLPKALAYAKHYVKGREWGYSDYEDPEIVKKYNDHSVAIFKENVDW